MSATAMICEGCEPRREWQSEGQNPCVAMLVNGANSKTPPAYTGSSMRINTTTLQILKVRTRAFALIAIHAFHRVVVARVVAVNSKSITLIALRGYAR